MTGAAGICAALGIGDAPALVAIVGGGGKSSLMFALARGLPGRVVLTTTTRIFAAQIGRAPSACSLSDRGWREVIAQGKDDVLLVGGTTGEHGLGVPPGLPRELLALDSVDHLVVEADGSRMRPVKAPAAHEPVIPEGTTLLVVVAGLDALEAPLGEVAHRPELVAELTGTPLDARLSPEALARLLSHPRGGLKHLPSDARAAIVLNKAETPARREAARTVARKLQGSRVDRLLVTALRSEQLFADSARWARNAPAAPGSGHGRPAGRRDPARRLGDPA